MSTAKAEIWKSDPTKILIVAPECNGKASAMYLSADEAARLAADLPAMVEQARANASERRCGTCGSHTGGCCCWGQGRENAPGWVRCGMTMGDSAGINCPAWTKREGGQAT